MRIPLVLTLLAAAGCSRAPTPEQTYERAWVAFRQGNLKQAQDSLSLSAQANLDPTQHTQADALTLLRAEVMLARGQAKEADPFLRRLPEPLAADLRLRWLVDRAEARWKTGHRADAMELLDQVDAMAGTSTADPVFKSLLLRSAMLTQAGQFEESEEILRTTARRAEAAGDWFNQAAAFLNFSFAKLRQERYDELVDFSRRAVASAEKAGAKRIVALANNNLGIAYTVLGDLPRAQEHLTTAVRQLRDIGDMRNLEDALGELGNVHLRAGHPDLAEKSFQEAVAISKRIDISTDAGRWAGQLAQAAIAQRKWRDAANWNAQAYSLFALGNEDGQRLYLKLNDAEVARGMGRPEAAIEIYRSLISEAKETYLTWTAHVQLASTLAGLRRFEDANREYEQGLKMIESVRSGLLSKDSQFRYHDLKMSFFKEYVDLLVTENQPERALQVVEFSRARVLAESLNVTSGELTSVQLDALRHHAGKTGSTLISYWLGPQRSFVWSISANGVRMHTLPREAEINDLVRTYRKAIEDDLRDPVQEALPQAARISKILLDPIRGDLGASRRVVLVPDGSLHTLNFETLPGEEGRYWIEDVELSVAPSLSILKHQNMRNAGKSSLLLVGAPLPAGVAYPALPSAETEIRAIQNHAGNLTMQLRAGGEATPGAFLNGMPEKFSMIHFAAHAEANAESPLDSAVILSPGAGGFKLYARDILGLKLSADVVTISACRSAGARSFAGEGLVGFAWAFLQSGAHAVIAGLWDVGDDSSAKLMDSLYQGLARGLKPAQALREAKLTLLRSSGSLRKPFYWAPYQTYIR